MERKRADEEHDDNKFQRLHMEAFAFVWSKIESAVKVTTFFYFFCCQDA